MNQKYIKRLKLEYFGQAMRGERYALLQLIMFKLKESETWKDSDAAAESYSER